MKDFWRAFLLSAGLAVVTVAAIRRRPDYAREFGEVIDNMSDEEMTAWFGAQPLTDQWLLDWRCNSNMSVKEIAEKSGLDQEEVVARITRLRDRLAHAAGKGE